jgi:hypothetical protein
MVPQGKVPASNSSPIVVPLFLLSSLFYPEDGGSRFLRNISSATPELRVRKRQYLHSLPGQNAVHLNASMGGEGVRVMEFHGKDVVPSIARV